MPNQKVCDTMMNRYKLSVAGIHATEGIERLNGNRELYESMLRDFPKDPNYKMLCEMLEQKKVTEAFRAAHALKGMAGNLSMTRLYESLTPLVELLRSGKLEGSQELLEKVTADYREVTQVVRYM